jgi:hypothetical protein
MNKFLFIACIGAFVIILIFGPIIFGVDDQSSKVPNTDLVDEGSSKSNRSGHSLSFEIILMVIFVLFSGLVGYFVGTIKSFREEKQRAYAEILPPIVQMAYNPSKADEGEFNKALIKLWLYANKTVAKKMDSALSILHNPSRGNRTEVLQEIVVKMREDIQVLPWQKLKPKEVNHLYTRIVRQDRETKNEKN